MSNLTNTFFAAAVISLATLAPASAAETDSSETSRQGSTVPGVISVAYRNPSVATTAWDVIRQGGFKVAGAIRWFAAPDQASPVAAFTAPGVISVAYRDPQIATSARDIVRQGGFATAGTVRWVPDAPVAVEAAAVTVRVGAL